jgi:hypothetical protein
MMNRQLCFVVGAGWIRRGGRRTQGGNRRAGNKALYPALQKKRHHKNGDAGEQQASLVQDAAHRPYRLPVEAQKESGVIAHSE